MNKAINYGFRRNGLVNGVPTPSIDGKYGIYASVQEACTQIPIEERAIGLTVGIEDINGSISEYWWKRGIGDNDLEAKNDFDSIQEQIDDLYYKIDHIVPVGPGGIEIIVGDTLSYDEDTKYLNVKNPLPETVYLSGSVFKVENNLTVSEYKNISLGSNVVISGSGINIKNKININEYGLNGSYVTLGGSNIAISGQYISLSGYVSNLFGSSIAIGDSNTTTLSIIGSSISIGNAMYISGSFISLNKIINSDFIVQNNDISGIISLSANEITLSGSSINLNGNTFISGNLEITGSITDPLDVSDITLNAPFSNKFDHSGELNYLAIRHDNGIILYGTDYGIELNGHNIILNGISGTINLTGSNILLNGDITLSGNEIITKADAFEIKLANSDANAFNLHTINNKHSINIDADEDIMTIKSPTINLDGSVNIGGTLTTGTDGSITIGYTGGGTGSIYIREGSKLYKFISGSFVQQ